MAGSELAARPSAAIASLVPTPSVLQRAMQAVEGLVAHGPALAGR